MAGISSAISAAIKLSVSSAPLLIHYSEETSLGGKNRRRAVYSDGSASKVARRFDFNVRWPRIVKIDIAVVHFAAMFDVILYQPEIPPNTGNIIRLCANTGVRLHLVKPMGFALEDKQLLRAGLDYHEFATITIHETWGSCSEHFTDRRIFAVSTKGAQRYDLNRYSMGDAFLFGPETRGLPAEMLNRFPEKQRIRLPMLPESRSLNLSNSVAVVVYEAWRQVEFGLNA